MKPALSRDIKSLREAVAALPSILPGHRRTYPASLRKRAVRLLEQGVSFKSLSREVGLRVDLLTRWSRSSRAQKASAVQPAPQVFAVEPPPPPLRTASRPQITAIAPLRLQLGAFVITVTLAEGQA